MKRKAWLRAVWLGVFFLGSMQIASAASPVPLDAVDVFLPHVNYQLRTGIWTSGAELASLPTQGPAWVYLMRWAQEDSSSPNLSDPLDDTDAIVMAKALVYARTGQPGYRDQVIAAVNAAIGTEADAVESLALARNLSGYVLAADLVGLPPDVDARFRSWLAAARHASFDDRTLINTHEQRPNNWGTHAGAARIAAALYLGDAADLSRAATVFRGWLGDRSAYAGFNFDDDLSWQCDPLHPVPVNPAGCAIAGHMVDGVLAEDQRRGGSFAWPPPKEDYVWEALQGAVAQAWVLERAGYPAFSWHNQALLRAVTWLHQQANFPAQGDDTGIPWLINDVYGTSFPTYSPARPGKNGLGFYQWILSSP
jgi:hypothetical protein